MSENAPQNEGPVPIKLGIEDYLTRFPTLTRPQVLAALMTAKGMTVDEICDRLSIGTVKLYEWRRSIKFQQLVADSATEIVAQVQDYLRRGLVEKLTLIEEMMRDPQNKPELRMECAKYGIELALSPSIRKLMRNSEHAAAARQDMADTFPGADPFEAVPQAVKEGE